MAKQIYEILAVRTEKEYKEGDTRSNLPIYLGSARGAIHRFLTSDEEDVFGYLKDQNGFWDVTVYEYPSFKPVTKAELTIT